MRKPLALFASTAIVLVSGLHSAGATPLATFQPNTSGMNVAKPLIDIRAGGAADGLTGLQLAQADPAQPEDTPEEDAKKPVPPLPKAKKAPPPPPAPKAEQPAPAPKAQEPTPAQEPAPAAEQPAAEPKAEQPAEAPAAASPPKPEAPADVPAAEQPAPAEAPKATPAEPEAQIPATPEPEASADAPAAEQPAPADAPKATPAEPKAQAPAAAPADQAEQPAVPAPGKKPAKQPAAGEAPKPVQKPAQQPAAGEAPKPAPKPQAEQPAAPGGEAPADAPAGTDPKAETPETETPKAEAPAAPADGTEQGQTSVTPETTLPVEGGAPVLDSAKEEPAPAADGQQQATVPAKPAEPAAPPPTTDAESQAKLRDQAVDIPNPLAEEGKRVKNRPDRRRVPDDARNVREVDNRVIFQFNNQIIIQHNESDRLRDRATDVYYEDLPRGRTREVITRPNGVQLVTIRNRWGDVIQRSKVLPGGREVLLTYVPEHDREERRVFRDPGRDLPPLQLTIPVTEYILDATSAGPEQYYDFLEEPPVENVERIYSLEEVKRSARIRDKVRRIDLDTLTFEFGKASIAEDQIERLSGVADAMNKILEDNPAETFLIEGHTDAVGSDEANLILSDKRAEAIAVALTDVFAIPPENLTTQGYGERYLKVRTESPERLNRRVTIRRITPLVTPVASR